MHSLQDLVIYKIRFRHICGCGQRKMTKTVWVNDNVYDDIKKIDFH